MLRTVFRDFCTATKVPKLPACNFPVELYPETYSGYSFKRIKEIRSDHLIPCLKSHFKEPLLIHQGQKQWLFDHTGKRYLDMFGGIVTVSVGHCHPRITEALTRQSSKLCHTTHIYYHPKVHEYAELFVKKFPGDLKVVYFTNSGSEANDLAMLMARLHSGNQDIISLRNSYHGGSPSTIALTAHGSWKYPMSVSNIHYAVNPDAFRGRQGSQLCRDSPIQPLRSCKCSGDCHGADFYVEDVQEIINYCLPKGRVAGFFAESIQGVGGVVQFPKGYLKKVYELVRRNGGVCIADEVQTGFGRTGSHYWGFEGHGVVPDIVTMAKGIGNGFPLAAVVTTPAIAQSMTKASHFNTFGGNPLASTVGMEVLKIIDDENLQQNSLAIGTYLMNKLADLRAKHSIVGDVRGKGLMLGVDLVTDQTSNKPLPSKDAASIWEACKDMGLLMGLGGHHGNVFRISPPMCVTREDADFTADVLDTAIEMFNKGLFNESGETAQKHANDEG